MQIRRALVVSVALVALAVAGGCSGDDSDPSNAELRIAFHRDPGTLDPALVGEPDAGNVIINLMDALVRLSDDLEPEPALAESWEESASRTRVTFRLREDGRWTNGDRVTAFDFEYAWKRVLEPTFAAINASQLFGILGATEYNACERNCERLRERVGVTALDDRTLEVRLTSPQPWFVGQVANVPFLPVHRATVERFGRRWTEPANIVTNGPYRLTGQKHGESITLTKWKQWRGADAVRVERFAGRIIRNATTALTAFEAGEIDACIVLACIPPDDVERLRDGDAYLGSPGLVTRFLGLNLKTLPNLDQRRALAFALDRTSLVENVTRSGERPATSLTPEGMPGFDAIAQDFLPEKADIETARGYLERASSPKRVLDLYYSTDDVPAEQIAVAVQAMWKQIGLRTELHGLEEEQYGELVGPPTNGSIDVFVWGTLADYGDDMTILEILTCESGYNPNGYCDARYDRLIERARATPDEADRHRIYAQAEELLTGSNGALPIIPTYWASLPTLREPAVDGWQPNLLGRHDLTKVSVAEE